MSEFQVGQKVRVKEGVPPSQQGSAEYHSATDSLYSWTTDMNDVAGKIGKVIEVTREGDRVRVEFESDEAWTFHPNSLEGKPSHVRITKDVYGLFTEGEVYEVESWSYDGKPQVIPDDDSHPTTLVDSKWEPVQGYSFGEVSADELAVKGSIVDTSLSPESFRLHASTYISSGMGSTPDPDDNRARFVEIEGIMTELGFTDIINPAELDEIQTGKATPEERLEYLKRDFELIATEVEQIVVFDDWQNSPGSTDEVYLGHVLGIPVFQLNLDSFGIEGEPGHENVIRVPDEPLVTDIDLPAPMEAKMVVNGARRYAYGHPLVNFTKIANLWNATVGHKLKGALDLKDVAMMMIQVKIAREYNSTKRDNIVDVIGYAYAYRESIEELERRGYDLESYVEGSAEKLKAAAADGVTAL